MCGIPIFQIMGSGVSLASLSAKDIYEAVIGLGASYEGYAQSLLDDGILTLTRCEETICVRPRSAMYGSLRRKRWTRGGKVPSCRPSSPLGQPSALQLGHSVTYPVSGLPWPGTLHTLALVSSRPRAVLHGLTLRSQRGSDGVSCATGAARLRAALCVCDCRSPASLRACTLRARSGEGRDTATTQPRRPWSRRDMIERGPTCRTGAWGSLL